MARFAQRWVFGTVVCALLCGIAMVSAPGVSAHARMKTSDPAAGATVAQAPAQIVLTFTQETSATKSSGSVTDASGATVSTGVAVDLNERTKMTIPLKAGLGPGAYTVSYHTFTDDDGGVVDDHFTFTVGPGGAAPVGGANATIGGNVASAVVPATRGPSVTLVPAVSTPVGGTAANATAANGGGGVPALVWVIVAVVVVGAIAFGARLAAARR